MEMAEELGLNGEEQVLRGTRGTRGALSTLALRGTRVLYRLYPLRVPGHPEAPHGVVCATAQALVAAHIAQRIEAWRSAQPSLRPVSVPPPPVPFSALHLRSHPVVRHGSVVRQVRRTPSAPNTDLPEVRGLGFRAWVSYGRQTWPRRTGQRCHSATVQGATLPQWHCCTPVQQ